MKSWLLVTFFFCLEGGVKSELTNNWPTYEHPDYKGRLCYYCPPGFYLVEPCKHSYKSEPGYSNCKKCEKGTFSGRWNDDPNCWDSEVCSIDRVKLFDGESTGPTICTCNSSSVVKNGECELGISKREHEALMLRQKRSFVCPVTTCPPCPDCPTKAEMKPLPTCPPCNVTNPTIEADNHQQVILGIFLALFICLFLGVVRAYIILYRENKKLKTKHKKDVEQGKRQSNAHITKDGINTGQDALGDQREVTAHTGNTEHQTNNSNAATRNNTQNPGNDDGNRNILENDQSTHMQDFACQTIDGNNALRTNRDGSNISRSSDNLTSSQSNTEPLSSHASTSPIPQQKNQKSKQDKKIEESELERDSLKNENERLKRSSMKLEKIVLNKDRSIIEDNSLNEAFRIIASSVINRSFDFYQQTLNLDSDICMKMERDNEGRSMPFKITDGLSKWKQLKGSSATLDSLINLLRNGNRNDIADKIEKNLNINSEKEHTERHQEGVKIKDDKDSSIEDAFREIPKRFSNISNFKRFARSSRGLSLSSDEVENIFDSESRQSRKEKECQILELWKEKNGDEATTSKLRQLVNTFLNEDDESGQAFTNQTNDGNNSAEVVMQTERFFTHEDGDADDKANPSENDCTQESGTTVAETVPKSHDQDATNSQETRPKVHSDDIPTSSAHSDMRVESTKESNQTEEEGLGIEPDGNGEYTVKSNDDDEVYEDVDHNEEDPTGTSGDHDKTSDKKTEKKKTKASSNQTNDGNNSSEAVMQTERFFTHEGGDADNKANPSENDCTQESGSTVSETVPKSHDQDATNSQETRPKVHSDDIPTTSAHSDMRVESTKESNQIEDEGFGIEPDENGEYTVKSTDDDKVYEDVDHNEEDPTGTSGDHDKSSGKKTKKKKDVQENQDDGKEKEPLLKGQDRKSTDKKRKKKKKSKDILQGQNNQKERKPLLKDHDNT
ncbi:uncharacterized protein LOC120343835 isoform X2 [Styela clava]